LAKLVEVFKILFRTWAHYPPSPHFLFVKIYSMLLDLLFPRYCLSCGKKGKYFCDSCLRKISLAYPQICPVCKKPAILGRTHSRCQSKLALDGLTSVFSYEGIIRKAIGKLKYKFITDLADELVELSIPRIHNSAFRIHNSICLVPVPLHPRRKQWRGFNQAELLGEKLCGTLRWDFRPDVLIRRRFTQPQTRLDKKQRHQNVAGAFKLNSCLPAGKAKFSILNSGFVVFDDVWTTGSTIKECGLVLKRGGARFVWGLSLAR
jgi:ComF family protein